MSKTDFFEGEVTYKMTVNTDTSVANIGMELEIRQGDEFIVDWLDPQKLKDHIQELQEKLEEMENADLENFF